MKNLGMPLLLMVLFSCNSEQKKSTGSSTQKDSTVSANNGQPSDHAAASFSLGAFDKNTPLKDSVNGNIVDGATWTDTDGTFMVLLGQTESKMVNGQQNQRINAYCFKKDGRAWQRQWLVQDKIENCEVDATCEFFPGSLSVTDNDKNNIAEVTFLYKLSCKGDVSPDEKKLIMYEGAKKFAIRGSTVIKLGDEKEGGDKKIDPAFNSAPAALLAFANQQWDKFGLTASY